MTHFSIRFSKGKDETNDSIASIQKIYKDINSGRMFHRKKRELYQGNPS